MPTHPTPLATYLSDSLEIIDLHLDIFIPHRLWGYDMFNHNTMHPFGRHFFTHSDIPRMQKGGYSGAMWSITTNPFRFAGSRWKVFLQNLQKIETLAREHSDIVAITPRYQEYLQYPHKHKILPSIQGANSLEGAPDGIESLPNPSDSIVRMTLVHLTPSVYGNTSSPFHWLQPTKGLSPQGKRLIEQMNARHIFVDLAHAHPKTFWDVIDVQGKGHPLLVTHTGVQGVKKHWRNLDDAQIKAIADTGGVIGIMFANNFLQHNRDRSLQIVIEHMEYLINIGGEDVVAFGSDFDGAISPPIDLRSADQLPNLLDRMVERGWSEERIGNILGRNFLRVFAAYRH
jgi:membrane dipeptidase